MIYQIQYRSSSLFGKGQTYEWGKPWDWMGEGWSLAIGTPCSSTAFLTALSIGPETLIGGCLRKTSLFLCFTPMYCNRKTIRVRWRGKPSSSIYLDLAQACHCLETLKWASHHLQESSTDIPVFSLFQISLYRFSAHFRSLTSSTVWDNCIPTMPLIEKYSIRKYKPQSHATYGFPNNETRQIYRFISSIPSTRRRELCLSGPFSSSPR